MFGVLIFTFLLLNNAFGYCDQDDSSLAGWIEDKSSWEYCYNDQNPYYDLGYEIRKIGCYESDNGDHGWTYNEDGELTHHRESGETTIELIYCDDSTSTDIDYVYYFYKDIKLDLYSYEPIDWIITTNDEIVSNYANLVSVNVVSYHSDDTTVTIEDSINNNDQVSINIEYGSTSSTRKCSSYFSYDTQYSCMYSYGIDVIYQCVGKQSVFYDYNDTLDIEHFDGYDTTASGDTNVETNGDTDDTVDDDVPRDRSVASRDGQRVAFMIFLACLLTLVAL